MKNNNENSTGSFELNDKFVAAKDIVSRRNQDGTVILMKLDNNNVFYKLDGVLALFWGQMQLPVRLETFNRSLQSVCSPEICEKVQPALQNFILGLAARELIANSTAQNLEEKESEIAELMKSTLSGDFKLGQIKDFNLDQIESEVLNDSIYLDVFAGSDLALKKDVSGIENALDKILCLEGIHFRWSAPHQDGSLQTGVVAQQVAEVMPELVRRDQDTGHLAVNYSKMVPYLIESVKQLKCQVEDQNRQILELRNRVAHSHS